MGRRGRNAPHATGSRKTERDDMPCTIPGRSIAFFDVDETLITIKSLLRFLTYHFDNDGADPDHAVQAKESLLRQLAAGAPREVLNRSYYRSFRGSCPQELARSGRHWFDSEVARGGLFHAPVRRRLESHRAAGRGIVLVSGSFFPCLGPIAEHVNAHQVLCTSAHTEAGVLTGEITDPVIGDEKAVRANRLMRSLGIRPIDCFAYGDDASDLPLLRAVGNPVVVGNDPVLQAWGRRYGWGALPGVSTVPVPTG
ncbi:HAD family phosphatase [Streptomyces sp. NBC_00347]|uniref:HAD family hydrolase n=1 Tax=Streptomyces sp. NBC_00347 TaxID=2975721 RepID=UPI00225BBD6E|nr:HAD-IB family hydrolase [Streptomyces sp. NBC_00347]MCX5130367.1 HAD-IB family hydrolase [Streptomyces sp. NBC_00347]